MATILLARHGETDWNRDHLWQGHVGPPLNDTGRRQAAELAEHVSNVVAVYSSDTVRAYETAVILAERYGIDVQTDTRLREVNLGLWEGLTSAQINERFGGGFARWLSGEGSTPDGGESDDSMASRVLAALNDIAQRHAADERVLVVASGGPIRAVQAHLRGIDQRMSRSQVETIENWSLFERVIGDGAWSAAGSSGRHSANTS